MPVQRSRRLPLLLLILLLAQLTAGCWDKREIEDRSNPLATGLDLCEEGEGCVLVATRQVAIPGRIPLGPGGGAQAGETVMLLRTTGKDVQDTSERAQARLNHPVGFGQIRIVVLGETFARGGLEPYLDYLRRLPDVRRRMLLVVTEGRAEAVMRATPALERVPALYLSDLIEDGVRSGRLPDLFLGEFLTATSNKGQDAIAPLLRMARPDLPALAGLAVFRGDRMVGTLNLQETATFMLLIGTSQSFDQIRLPVGLERWADLSVRGRGSQFQLAVEQGRLHANLRLELEGDLYQLSPGLTGSDPAILRMVERAAAAEVKQRAERLLERLQTELGSDILALGERVRAKLPAYWSTAEDWPAAFAAAHFRVEVEVQIRRTGGSMD